MLCGNKLFGTVLLLAVMMSAVPHAYGMDGRGRSQGQKPTCQDCQRSLKLREKAKRRAIMSKSALAATKLEAIEHCKLLVIRCQEEDEKYIRLHTLFQKVTSEYLSAQLNWDDVQRELKKNAEDQRIKIQTLEKMIQMSEQLKLRKDKENRKLKIVAITSSIAAISIYKCAQYLWNKCSMGNHPKVTKTRDMVD